MTSTRNVRAEGTEFTAAPAKIARITPAGAITEFAPDVADGCNDRTRPVRRVV
jgi:hypothetical protein